MNGKSTLGAGIIFILVGIALLIGGIMLYLTTEAKISESRLVSATIVEIETTRTRTNKKNKVEYHPYVRFTYNDTEYEHYALNYYTASMQEGQSIQIYVHDSGNGFIEVIGEGQNTVTLILFCAFGLVSLGVGIGFTVVNLKNMR